MGLGDLSGGAFSSSASGVSADGSVVVGVSSSAPGTQAFRWTQSGGMVGLGDLPGGYYYSTATDVSDDGSVVVGESYFLGTFSPGCQCWLPRLGPFRWTQADGISFVGGYGSIGSAYDTSADGAVIVGVAGGAFRWTQSSGIVGLGELPSGTFASAALGVSADGSVVVGYSSTVVGTEAFRWTQAGGAVGLGDLPGGSLFSEPRGISADGSVVVGKSSSESGPESEAFRWTQGGGMAGLGVLPGFTSSLAYGVSTGGSIVVGNSSDVTGSEAFLWDATHGMRSLRDVLVNDYGLGASLAGWSLTSANDISADGQFIVGSGTNPSGDAEAWIARLAPSADLPGDFNLDGTVDAADYVVWRKTDDTPSGYNTWRSYFGQAAGGGAGLPSTEPLSAAVPEPTSLFLCALSLWAIGIFAFRKPWRDRSCSRRLGSNVV
jgi:probable HAF family extracellular repeat protein